MSNYDLICVTTFVNLISIDNLLKSIILYNKNVDICVVIVAQNNNNIDSSSFTNCLVNVKVINVKSIISLSKARNIALNYILENGIKFSYLMFPDDDSSFDSVFFNHFNNKVNGNTIVDVYCENDSLLYKSNNYKCGVMLSKNNFDAVMSVNLVVDYQTVITVGLFDERMGVGTAYGSGEDIDYFIRCCTVSKRGFYYEKQLWNYHPKAEDKYKDMSLTLLLKRYKNYGCGMIFLFSKHSMYLHSVKCVFAALAGSLYSFITFNFKLSVARFYAFFVRGTLMINLLLQKK